MKYKRSVTSFLQKPKKSVTTLNSPPSKKHLIDLRKTPKPIHQKRNNAQAHEIRITLFTTTINTARKRLRYYKNSLFPATPVPNAHKHIDRWKTMGTRHNRNRPPTWHQKLASTQISFRTWSSQRPSFPLERISSRLRHTSPQNPTSLWLSRPRPRT